MCCRLTGYLHLTSGRYGNLEVSDCCGDGHANSASYPRDVRYLSKRYRSSTITLGFDLRVVARTFGSEASRSQHAPQRKRPIEAGSILMEIKLKKGRGVSGALVCTFRWPSLTGVGWSFQQ